MEVSTNGHECRVKVSRKENQYKIQGMWNMKCVIVQAITGTIGGVTKGLRKKLEAIPGKHSIDSLQKTAVLLRAHVVRKVLQAET